jgi:NitT/TauT family transport system substrate-binding protein
MTRGSGEAHLEEDEPRLPRLRDERDIARFSAGMLSRRSFLAKAAMLGAAGAVAAGGLPELAGAATRQGRAVHPAGRTAAKSLGTLRVAGPPPSWDPEDAGQGSGAIDTPIELKLGITDGINHNIDFSYVGSGAQPGQGQLDFVAGELDSTSFGASGAAIAVLQGYDLVIACATLWNSRWIVQGGSPYKTVQDLQGKTVATTIPSSDTYRAIKLALAVNGLDFETDFQVVTGSPVANLALFERGGVDCYIAIEPEATELVGGGAHQICTTGQLWAKGSGSNAPFFLNGPAFYTSFAKHHQRLVDAYCQMQLEVNEYIHKHPLITQKYANWYGISRQATPAAYALLPKRLPLVYPTYWDQSVTQDIDLQIKWGVKEGIITQTPANPVYITSTYTSAGT